MKHVKPPIVPENIIHEAVIEHLRTYAKPGVVFWHTPNGGKRSVQWASKLKRMGVLPGVSDIILFYRGSLFCLELKAANGRPTEAQHEFLGNVQKQRGHGCIAYSIDSAINALKLWGVMLDGV